eukprot:g6926.t1
MGAGCCKAKLSQVDVDLKETKTIAVGPTEIEDDHQVVSFREDSFAVETRIKSSTKFRQDKDVKDNYKLGRILGTGGFSAVKLATERRTLQQYACKIMTLPDQDETVEDHENSRGDIFKEIEILCFAEHENVMFLKEFYIEGDKVYLITELLSGGELLDAVLQRGNYSEADACSCFRQLLKGIAYLHSKGIVHRDLKLENLMLASQDDIATIRIVDFGLAKRLSHGVNRMATVCGTPQYVAPEIIQGNSERPGYSKSVDLWSAGVILFILLGGYPPFDDENESVMFEQIKRGMFTFNDPVWDNISVSAKNLIRRLLTVNPDVRLTAEECLEHDWFSICLPETPLTTTTANLKMNYERQIKKAVNVVLTVNKVKRLTIAEDAPTEFQE